MAENNKPCAQEEKDEGANPGAKVPASGSQDNDDVSEAPADPDDDSGQ
jgi:hypothetical protein